HPVRDILAEKHPSLRTPNLLDPNNLAFADYGEAPDIIPIDCPLGDAERVALQLHGSTGCSGVDAEHLKNQLLKHGKASAELREELVEWALWLANTAPLWALYRAMQMALASSVAWQCSGKYGTNGRQAHDLPTTSTAMNAGTTPAILLS
ncbi:hypothetical protein ACHAW6_002690, partial [Cyclotella cf. meneghiniana]